MLFRTVSPQNNLSILNSKLTGVLEIMELFLDLVGDLAGDFSCSPILGNR